MFLFLKVAVARSTTFQDVCLVPQIDATCMRFKLDETVRNRLTNAMRGRAVTFKVMRAREV